MVHINCRFDLHYNYDQYLIGYNLKYYLFRVAVFRHLKYFQFQCFCFHFIYQFGIYT